MMKLLKRSPGALLTSAMLVVLCAFTGSANAASFVVSKVADTNDGTCNNDCSLREAVGAANAAGAVSTITFNPTVFAAPRKTILSNFSINISQNVTITAPAAGVTVQSLIDGNVFTVNAGFSATFDGLTLTSGHTGVENDGTVTLTNCTLSGNSYGLLNYGDAATLVNCTVSGNGNDGIVNGADAGSGSGSGIGALVASSTATITNCTVSGNGAGINNIGTATVRNSILVGNSVDTGGNAITDGGNNIIGGTVTAAGLDPAGLQDNGGQAPTIALVAGSPAINTASDANAPAKDERGVTRPQGPHSDIGAYEAQSGLAVRDAAANEGNSGTTDFVFTVKLLLPNANNVTVGYATADGTATAGTDYTAKSGTVTIPAGQTSATITVLGKGDTTVEPSETFFVNLSSPVNAPIIDGQGVGTITADDFETPSLVVNTTSGALDNTDGVTSLSDAVAYANSDPDYSAITFNPTVFAAPRKIITLASGLILTSDVSVTGPAAGVTVESGRPADSVFYLKSGFIGNFNGLTASKGVYGILSSGTATITNCTLSGNNDTGFYNYFGDATLTNCTLNGQNFGVQNLSGTATLTNCTLAGNSFSGLSNTTGTVNLANCTVSGNTGGLKNDFSGHKLNLKNTIVAGNTTNTDGPMTYGVNNIAATTGTAADAGLETDINGQPILKDNDGPTQTIALIAGGAAVDAASDADAPATDQRGYARPQGTHSDIGAFELGPLALVINDVSANEGNSGTTNFVFTVKLLRTSANAVTVGYATADGTATAGTDYTATSGTLTIPAGAYSATITVPVKGDTAFEPNETFFVNLSNPVNATISDGQGLGTIKTDEFDTPSLVVTTTSDALDNTDGVISLRDALALANSNPDPSTITFNIPVAQKTVGVWVINTASLLAVTENTTITGPGAGLLTVQENNASKSFAIFEIHSDTTLSGLTISKGSYGLANPSPANLTLTNCVVSGNGPGIYNEGTLTLTSSTLSGNSDVGAVNQGTATLTDCTVSGNGAPGLLNNSGKTATVTNCTLSNNAYGMVNSGTVTVTDSTVSGNTGFGINNTGTATVTGSTFSGNGDHGFLNVGGTPSTLTNCTLSGNVYGILNSATVTVTNCTITGNTNTGILTSGGTTTVQNSLVIGNATNLNGSLAAASSNNLTTGTAADAGLDPNGLKDNGGPTKTIALLSTSPARDVANDANAPAKDQRGVARPQGTHSDIGAYEFQVDVTAPTVRFTTSATTPAGTTPVSGSTIFGAMPTITGAADDAGSGVASVALRLYRATSTAGVYEYWNGSAWVAGPTNLPTVLNPAEGGASVSWSKSGGWPTSTNLADGTYFLQALCTDKANNSSVAGSYFKKATDTAVPAITIVTPVHLSTVKTFVSATGTAIDNAGGSGIGKVEMSLRRTSDLKYWSGSAWVTLLTQLPATVSGTGWSKSTGWPAAGTDATTQLLDGNYTLAARAFDKAGNNPAAASSTFTVDSSVPVGVAITAPANLSILKTLTSVTGTAADNAGGSGIGHVDVNLRRISDLKYWDGSAWGTAVTQLPTTVSGTGWSKSSGLPAAGTDAATQLTEGKYMLLATAYDKAGNKTALAARSDFTIDSTVPVSVAITAPAHLSVVKSIASLTGTAADNSGGTGIGRVDVSLRRISDSKYWDGSAWVTTVTQLPTTVSGTGWSKSSGLPAAGTDVATQLTEGKYTLLAAAYDKAGNKAALAARSDFTVDFTVPTTVAIATPANLSVLKALAPMTGTATDNTGGTGIGRVDVSLRRISDSKYWDGTTWGTALTQLPTTVSGTSWNKSTGLPAAGTDAATQLTEGKYTLLASAFDKAGNKTVLAARSDFTIDRTLPTVAITSPANLSTVSVLTTVSGTGFDGGSGLASVNLTLKRLSDNMYWTGTAWTATATTLVATAKPTTLGNATWTYGSVTQPMPTGGNLVDGSYLLSARGVDKAGNLSVAVNSQFTLKRTAALSNPQAPAETPVASSLQLSNASATADGRVTLTFTGAVDGNTALDTTRYSVTRDDVAIVVESVQSPSSSTVVLGLEENRLSVGDHVKVSFDLKDREGRSLAGQALVTVH